jgi:hypothetical protein
MDERLSGLHALSDAVLTCFGGIDRCHNPQMRHLLRSDTPRAITPLDFALRDDSRVTSDAGAPAELDPVQQ